MKWDDKTYVVLEWPLCDAEEEEGRRSSMEEDLFSSIASMEAMEASHGLYKVSNVHSLTI
jgi:hypothetical protein